MMNLAKHRCFEHEAANGGVKPATRLFFTCLDKDAGSEQSQWFNGVKKNIVRFLFQTDCQEGAIIDHTVSCVYELHVKAANRALTEHGYSLQNSYRKLVFTCLGQVAGRSGEMSWLLLESFEWDPFFCQVFAELPGLCSN